MIRPCIDPSTAACCAAWFLLVPARPAGAGAGAGAGARATADGAPRPRPRPPPPPADSPAAGFPERHRGRGSRPRPSDASYVTAHPQLPCGPSRRMARGRPSPSALFLLRCPSPSPPHHPMPALATKRVTAAASPFTSCPSLWHRHRHRHCAFHGTSWSMP